jgi:hypothetical protein
MVRKEIWGRLLVYNLIRAMMARAAQALVIGTQKGPTSASNPDPPGFMGTRVVLGILRVAPELGLDLRAGAGYRAAAG